MSAVVRAPEGGDPVADEILDATTLVGIAGDDGGHRLGELAGLCPDLGKSQRVPCGQNGRRRFALHHNESDARQGREQIADAQFLRCDRHDATEQVAIEFGLQQDLPSADARASHECIDGSTV